MEIPEDVGLWAIIFGWAGTIAAWFFRGGRKYQDHAGLLEDHEERITHIEGDYMTAKDQQHCQQHLTDSLLLAIEKRDREFDRKFSSICQGIGEIKAELRKDK